jgi:hypothetical protein
MSGNRPNKNPSDVGREPSGVGKEEKNRGRVYIRMAGKCGLVCRTLLEKTAGSWLKYKFGNLTLYPQIENVTFAWVGQSVVQRY